MGRKLLTVLLLMAGVICTVDGAVITETVDLDVAAFSSPIPNLNGLAAQATFKLDDSAPAILIIDLKNTSTGVPTGFSNADQLLTGISFDLGGLNIIGGSVVIGEGSESKNFDIINVQLTEGDDVSGEWGYSNIGSTGTLLNMVSANSSHVTAFGSTNLDGTTNLNGPQAGICAAAELVPIAGLGCISDSVTIEITLDGALSNLDFLDNGVVAEFGSDAAFATPEPATITILGLGALVMFRRK